MENYYEKKDFTYNKHNFSGFYFSCLPKQGWTCCKCIQLCEYIDPEVIEMFEEETGIRVEYNEFVTNEDMFPVIQTGAVEYDVVAPSDYDSKMIEEDLLQEINFDNIPNIKNIDPIHWESSQNLILKTNIAFLIVGELLVFYITPL